MIELNAYTVHRDARFWPEPDRFLPERWLATAHDSSQLEAKKASIHQCAYFPFSEGQRNCLGKVSCIVLCC